MNARALIAHRHRIQFFRQMEMLLSSGVLAADALARLAERYPERRTRGILRETHARVAASRATLSEALALFPRSFPPSVVAVIEAGEQGGSLALAERFADLAERAAYEEAHRRQLRRACAYPLLVLALAAALHLLLLGVVFPRLAALLASVGGTLPPLTRNIIALSAFVRRAAPAAAAGLAAVLGCGLALRRHPAAARPMDRLLLRLPGIGPIYRCLAVALVCKIYGSLHRAHRPAPEIVRLCSKLVGNSVFREGMREIERQLACEGATLAGAFARSGLFPPLACLAIDVGEQSGRIAPAMERLAEHFAAQGRERIDVCLGFLQPALTLAVVGGAGLVLIAFFQGLYQLSYAIH